MRHLLLGTAMSVGTPLDAVAKLVGFAAVGLPIATGFSVRPCSAAAATGRSPSTERRFGQTPRLRMTCEAVCNRILTSDHSDQLTMYM